MGGPPFPANTPLGAPADQGGLAQRYRGGSFGNGVTSASRRFPGFSSLIEIESFNLSFHGRPPPTSPALARTPASKGAAPHPEHWLKSPPLFCNLSAFDDSRTQRFLANVLMSENPGVEGRHYQRFLSPYGGQWNSQFGCSLTNCLLHISIYSHSTVAAP
jgi:hypothetical protein